MNDVAVPDFGVDQVALDLFSFEGAPDFASGAWKPLPTTNSTPSCAGRELVEAAGIEVRML
ncbi:MAG TPA: hypothetical protein VN929_01725 [Burkholderiales bacterium]|nr:hypothetical protein [Burkholderiales bacterium]